MPEDKCERLAAGATADTADATPPCFFFHAPLVLSQMRTTTVDRAALHRQAGPATASFPRSALTARARAGVRRRAALVAVAPRASAVSSDASLTRPPADGRDLYAPPSFTALVADATASLAAALEDGRKLVEVEFPALPGDKDGAREGEKEGEREKEGGGGGAAHHASFVRALTIGVDLWDARGGSGRDESIPAHAGRVFA